MKETIITSNSCTIFDSPIEAGFPNIVDGDLSSRLNINDYLIDNKTATYFVRVKGDSMQGAGIFNGDILIVDRSKTVVSGKIIIACINGEFTVKRLILKDKKTILFPENPKYTPIEITQGMDFEIFGVVTYNIHKQL